MGKKKSKPGKSELQGGGKGRLKVGDLKAVKMSFGGRRGPKR